MISVSDRTRLSRLLAQDMYKEYKQLRKSLGVTDFELLVTDRKTSSMSEEHASMIKFCLENIALNPEPWEKKFITDKEDYEGPLSEKQIDTLHRITKYLNSRLARKENLKAV